MRPSNNASTGGEDSAHDAKGCEADQNSTMRILLSQGAQAKSAEAAPARGTETILLVEDERAVRALVVRVLLRRGYVVLQAGNGKEALAVAERHRGPIHLLLTDVVMPQMGGRELAERLTAGRPGLRVLFVSGYTGDEVMRHGISHERVHFLPKPLSPAALAQKVRDVLDAPPVSG
jgi:CheY-like chemotaxis protein